GALRSVSVQFMGWQGRPSQSLFQCVAVLPLDDSPRGHCPRVCLYGDFLRENPTFSAGRIVYR
ncbi:MAG TPA: hypothetical protein VKV04_19245, partial [Verrucomicrobiae bacterium]|nr:hypothetical protein [Verrucomicrobiae bacterium]